MRNYRASKQGLTAKLVNPNPVKPNVLNLVNPIVKPCSVCPALKKQIENLTEQIQNLASKNQKILSAKEVIQKQLAELENSKVKKQSKTKTKEKTPRPVDKGQPLKVDLVELEKETGLKKD
jgi:regulator of replication initiation timing